MSTKLPTQIHRTDEPEFYLQDVVPLDTPLVINIDPTNMCNFKCIFCPTGNDELRKITHRPSGHMTLELFKKLIDDIKQFSNKVKTLLLHKDGEPLLNKNIIEMIKYAKQADCFESIVLTTNASLLTPSISEKLVTSGVDIIRCSIYHTTDEGYKELTRNNIAYLKIIENIKYLYDFKESNNKNMHIFVKTLNTDMSQTNINKFFKDFEDIADTVNIDGLIGYSNTSKVDLTLGKAKYAIDGKSELNYDRVVCPDPFKQIAINFNGEVSVCCVDWNMVGIIGDANTESVIDIWNGDKLREHRITQLKGNRDTISTCQGCQYIYGIKYYNDLDSKRDEILSKLTT